MTKGILAAATLIVGFAWADPAQALTVASSPFGNEPVFALIGSTTQQVPGVGAVTRQVIYWQRKSDSACNLNVIGDASGLYDDYVVNGGPGNDRLELSYAGDSNSFCHRVIHGLVYGGHYLDLDGKAGDDTVICGTSGDTYLFGSDGNDALLTFSPTSVLAGGAGNDSLYANSSGSAEILVGDAGNDCLRDLTGSAAIFAGGDGTDSVAGTKPVNATSVELTTFSCQAGVIPT